MARDVQSPIPRRTVIVTTDEGEDTEGGVEAFDNSGVETDHHLAAPGVDRVRRPFTFLQPANGLHCGRRKHEAKMTGVVFDGVPHRVRVFFRVPILVLFEKAGLWFPGSCYPQCE